MRLPEAKIREAILHPDKLARHAALSYFGDGCSRDAGVMPQAIQAIETYGRPHAFRDIGLLARLPQTEATIEWVIRQLHQDDRAEGDPRDFSVFSRLVCRADPRLVLPRADEILQAPRFEQELADEFRERRKLASWDAAACWKELERIAAEAMEKPDASEVDLGRAERVVEALARTGESNVDFLLQRLAYEVTDYETDPMLWMEIFLVMLAGEIRLDQSIPLLAQKLRQCEELLSDECVTALAKIGTDAAAEAVAEGWPASEWHYRLYAVSALEKIHTDTTVRKCLDFLPQEQERDVRGLLADALLAQFAEEGIDPVLPVVRQRSYDAFLCDVKGRLVSVSTVLGVTFPEYPTWKREVEKQWDRQDQRMKELEARNKTAAESVVPLEDSPAPEQPDWDRQPVPFQRTDKPVGRNDPCPCGSGKKFKKCCLNRPKG